MIANTSHRYGSLYQYIQQNIVLILIFLCLYTPTLYLMSQSVHDVAFRLTKQQ